MSDAGATRGPKKEASPSEALLVAAAGRDSKNRCVRGCPLGSCGGGLLAGLLEAVSKALGGRLRASFGLLFVLLGASWGVLGASVGRPGALLGRKAGFFSSWSLSGAPLGPVSGASWAVLSGSWAVWGPSWAVWGPSWAVLGASWGALGPSWSSHGSFLGCLGASEGRKGENDENIEKTNENQ